MIEAHQWRQALLNTLHKQIRVNKSQIPHQRDMVLVSNQRAWRSHQSNQAIKDSGIINI